MWIALVSAGIVITNATSNTSMTSTSGVMLISLSTSVSSAVEMAMGSDRLQPLLGPPFDAQHGVLREVEEVVREIIEVGAGALHAAHEEIECEHGGDRDRDS